MTDPISTLITTYHELNAAIIDDLPQAPTPLEFHRYIAKNRPFVVRRAAAEWAACWKWDAEYLLRAMEGRRVKVAKTPFGNADAVVEVESGRRVFVEPFETEEPFQDFLRDIRGGGGGQESLLSGRVVKYAQTQNDNLRNEYLPLAPDVPPDIPFAHHALDKSADAINLWIGDDHSTTSLHKDNYENLYIQIRGRKHFTLLSPIEMPCVNEQLLRTGRYKPAAARATADTAGGNFEIELACEGEDGEDGIPVAVWDPDIPEQNATEYSQLAKPLRVTLEEGDLLYLPAMWYHKVGQTVGKEGFVCAVNYWYDMEFSGQFWAVNAFVREVVEAERLRPRYPRLEVGGDGEDGEEG